MLLPKTALGAHVTVHDVCSSTNAGAPSVITAGGGLDNVKVTGQTVDRMQGSPAGMAMSAVLSSAYMAALGAGQKLFLAHEIQESADGSAWDTAVVLEATTQVATSGGGGNVRGVYSPSWAQLDLTSRKRYFRINVTPDLDRVNTDTASFHTQAVLGGYDVLPQ